MYAVVVVALDGSDLGERALPYAEALAEKFASRLVLLQAIPSLEMIVAGAPLVAIMAAGSAVDPIEMARAERRAAESYLGGVAQRLRARGLTVAFECAEGRPATVIVERARDLNGELIAMTTHGRGGLGRLLLGSVADEVVRSAPCPVLLVRAEQHRQAGSAAARTASG